MWYIMNVEIINLFGGFNGKIFKSNLKNGISNFIFVNGWFLFWKSVVGVWRRGVG